MLPQNTPAVITVQPTPEQLLHHLLDRAEERLAEIGRLLADLETRTAQHEAETERHLAGVNALLNEVQS